MNKLKIVTVLMTFLALSMSCQTSPVNVVEYRSRPLPDIVWPTLPDPKGVVKESGELVTMPQAYWLALARYVIDVEAGIDLVEAYRGVK